MVIEIALMLPSKPLARGGRRLSRLMLLAFSCATAVERVEEMS